jgi:hypothetical protein
MKFAMPGAHYDPRVETERNRQIELADQQNHKKGQDVEIGNARLILTASDGTRWALSVSASGVLSAVAV